MKSINVKVPRELIVKFYPHPEVYGDFVVDLVNGMYTDVYYREDGDFITPTNDTKLIRYLKDNPRKSREYLYRNGVFSLRKIFDYDHHTFREWEFSSSKKIEVELSNINQKQFELILCYKWVEVGLVKLSSNKLTLIIYEKELIDDLDINIAFDLIRQYLSNI